MPAAPPTVASPCPTFQPATVGSCDRCSDCGQIFGSRQAKIAHQLLSSAPYENVWPPEPSWPLAPGAQPAALSLQVGTGGQHHAPKHGVRLLRSMLEVTMVLPLLASEPIAAVDLEGDLSPSSPDCAIDMLQIYLPNADIVLLVHAVSLPKQPLAQLLNPWLSSPAHLKLLCDARADADALNHLYGIRIAGVVDVQVCHAAATGENFANGGVSDRGGVAFFPTGLSKLTATYCSRELSAPIAGLKADFGAIFDSGRSPFRTLPLSPAAATYAASDVWNTFLVYEALWPTLEVKGLAAQVMTASERRAGEFRDVVGGREAWAQAIAQRKAGRTDRKSQSPAAVLPAAPAGGGLLSAATPIVSPMAPAAPIGVLPAVPAARVEPPLAAMAVDEAAPPKEKKVRVVSGPQCVCCGVRFTGEAQLEEHKQGKRHQIALTVYQGGRAPTIAVECRQAPLEASALAKTFEEYGPIATASLQDADPTGKPARVSPAGKPGPWFATVVYREAAAAARALGQRYLYVGDKRVYVEVV